MLCGKTDEEKVDGKDYFGSKTIRNTTIHGFFRLNNPLKFTFSKKHCKFFFDFVKYAISNFRDEKKENYI